MRRTPRDLPAPPELPSFRVEADPEERAQSDAERHVGTGLTLHSVELEEARIDSDAVKVVRRLERAGFQAYLVGGCVRDLLLGGKPKDYDVATSARPEDVRALFRNCRIIGRRFRLAHVHYPGNKIIEVATFRRTPQLEAPEDDTEIVEDLLIRNDNVFGEAHEDALRRDFTINALFYDIDRKQVLDWCGGMAHIAGRTIDTIGDPEVRFREDPIRILRAIKFAARADLGIAPHVYDAMVTHRHDLGRSARPRLFEEIARLMRGGAAHRSMWLFWETGCMAVLLPELSTFLDDDEGTEGGVELFFRRINVLDRLTKERGAPLDDLVLWSSLLAEPIAEACEGSKDIAGSVHDFLDPILARIAMPRRVIDSMAKLKLMTAAIRRGKIARVARSELLDSALTVLEIEATARGHATQIIHDLRAEYVRPQAASRGERGERSGRSRGGRGRGDRPRTPQ